MIRRLIVAIGVLSPILALSAYGTAGATSAGSTAAAGWLVQAPSVPVTVATARFTVPPVTCGVVENSAAFDTVAVNALNGGFLVLDTHIIDACVDGVALYEAAGIGHPFTMTISPGDIVVLRSSYGPPGTHALQSSVDDLTSGVSQKRTGSYAGSHPVVSAFVGIETSNSQSDVSDFGTVRWSKATVNGESLGLLAELPYVRFVMKRIKPKRVLVSTGNLSSSGSGFTNTWETGH